MNVILMKNKSENNRVTKDLETISTITGNLREESSVIDPVFKISGQPETVMVCNYLYCTEFKRYYFVKNISSIRNNLWEITCHVDVLQTYAVEIKANSAVVKRQENKWNLYLDDGIFKTYQNPSIITKAFPGGFSTQNFVLAIAGGN